MADIDIKVVFDSAKAEQSAKNMDKAIKDMGGSADKAQTPFSGLWKQIFIGVNVAEIAGKAVHEFTQFIADSITAATEAEKVNAALKSALGATGREVDANARHFIAYASSLQKSTIYNDEAIKGAQTLLLQLTTLDRDGIDRATRGAIGLSSVLGIDLQSAAMIVAKAMEGNTAALGRYGIKVRETGTAEEKRNELLQKLEGFYKRATDATSTFAGKQAQLKNNLDDFKETVGNAIIENKTLQKTVDDLSLSFQYLAEHGDILGKVISGIFQGALGPGGMLLLKLMGGLADKQREINKANEDGQKWAGEFNKQLIAIGQSGKDLSGSPILGFFVDLCKETEEGGMAFKVTDEWAKKFGVTLRSTVIKQINETKEALKRLKASGEATPGAIEALNKKIKDLEAYLKRAGAAADKLSSASAHCGVALIKTLVPAARDLNDVFGKTPVVVAQAYTKSASALSAWVKKNKDAIQGVIAFTQQALGTLQALYSANYSDRMNKLDEESRRKQEAMDADYERRRKDIEDSTLSEAAKQAALEALDKEYAAKKETAEKEYETKKKTLQKEAGEKQKALAIIQAVINTAEAVTKAWTLGPIIGPIMAGIAAAMGAVQIALIKKQAIPLAKGALFDRPTLLVGGKYEVSEHGQKEVAVGVEPLMKEIRNAIKEGMAAKGGGQVYVRVFIGQEELEKLVIKTVTRQGALRRYKIPSEIVS